MGLVQSIFAGSLVFCALLCVLFPSFLPWAVSFILFYLAIREMQTGEHDDS